MKRTLCLGLLLALCISLCAGAVSAEQTLPSVPGSGAYQYTNALQLTEATSAATTTKEKSAVRLKPTLCAEALDLTDYDYLHLWLYVSDASLLYDNNGDGLELASGGKQDTQENTLYFSYTKAQVPTINADYSRLQTGWNEYLLKISDFQVKAGGELNAAALNYVGLVLRSNPAGLTFAMSAIYAVREEEVTGTRFGALPVESGIPAIPTSGRYVLADTALQLTQDACWSTAAEAGKWFRLLPELTEEQLDLTAYQYLYLWIYITETDLHNGDSIELCSGGTWDKQENAVRFNSWFNEPLQAGWNECLVPLSAFTFQTGGGWKQDAIDFISVVLRSKAAVQTGAISRIYAVTEADVTDLAPASPVEEPIPQGRYTLKPSALQLTTKAFWGTTTEANKHVRLAPTLTQTSFDLSEYDYLYTWLYLSATDLATGDSIELCSGGSNDKQENAVRLMEWSGGSLRVGWNELMIPLNDFKYATGGGLDSTALNFIGVVFRSRSGVMTGMVSEIYALMDVDFVDTQPSGEEPPVGNGRLGRGDLICDFEEAAAVQAENTLVLSKNLDKAAQPGYYTYLCAEIYLENKSLLSRSNAALTISSSAQENTQELSYPLARQSLREGWNTVFLPVADFRMSGYDYDDPGYDGICDLLGICRVGVKWALRSTAGEAEPVLKLGKLTLTNSNVTEALPQGSYLLKDGAMAITTGEVSTTVTGGADKSLARLMPEINYGAGASVDISDKQYLYFWLYVSDAEADDSTVSDNELELASGGKCDEEENAIRLYRITEEGEPWLMSGDYGDFRSGWNEYAVPIRDLTRLTNKSGEQGIGCNYRALNYLRIYFHTRAGMDAADVTYAISTVYAINPWDLSADGASLPDLRPEPELPVVSAPTGAQTVQKPLSFLDVNAGDWYYDAVAAMVHEGLMNGLSEREFAPHAPVSRAMLVTILHRAEGLPAAGQENPFSDVPDAQWYTEAVLWAAEKGLVLGCGDGRFAPEEPVSRQQLAVILWRMAGSPAPNETLERFADRQSVSDWAMEATAWCVQEGILRGVDSQTLGAAQTATRAEIATLLCRYLGLCL